jgi:hypothetical protein
MNENVTRRRRERKMRASVDVGTSNRTESSRCLDRLPGDPSRVTVRFPPLFISIHGGWKVLVATARLYAVEHGRPFRVDHLSSGRRRSSARARRVPP